MDKGRVIAKIRASMSDLSKSDIYVLTATGDSQALNNVAFESVGLMFICSQLTQLPHLADFR